jgi:hypothetical protein
MKRLSHTKKLALTLVPLVVVVGVAIGTIAVVNHVNASKTKAVHEPVATTNPVQVVRDLVTEKYANSVKIDDRFGTGVTYQLAGYDFAAVVSNSAANSARLYSLKPLTKPNTTNIPTSLLPAAIAKLQALGYAETTKGIFKPETTGIDAFDTTYFVKDDSVCMWYAGLNGVDFTCAGQARLRQVAQLAQPFAAGLAQDLGSKTSQVALFAPDIKKNPQNPKYEHAVVRFMGAEKVAQPNKYTGEYGMTAGTAYYYRAIGAANWTFLRWSQQGVGCDDLSGVPALALSDICRVGDI